MANSNTELVNLALIELGQDTISSLATDQSETAKICRAKWPAVRDAVLRAGAWRCLTKRAALSRMGAAPAFGYSYQFQLPNFCFRVLSVYPANSAWDVEGNRVLLSNEDAISIRYIEYDTAADSVALFDSLLTAVLVAQLAATIAPSVKSAGRVKELWAIRNQAMADAKSVSALEGTPETASCVSLTTGVR